MKPEVGQLWYWHDGRAVGKCFLIIELFTHVNSFGDEYDAARYVLDGEIDWDHTDVILMYAEVINEAG